jgi:hypothetical protein
MLRFEGTYLCWAGKNALPWNRRYNLSPTGGPDFETPRPFFRSGLSKSWTHCPMQEAPQTRRGRSIWLAASPLVASITAASIIYLTHPVDPDDEGLLVGLAAFLWPFLAFPAAWITCVILGVLDYRADCAGRHWWGYCSRRWLDPRFSQGMS